MGYVVYSGIHIFEGTLVGRTGWPQVGELIFADSLKDFLEMPIQRRDKHWLLCLRRPMDSDELICDPHAKMQLLSRGICCLIMGNPTDAEFRKKLDEYEFIIPLLYGVDVKYLEYAVNMYGNSEVVGKMGMYTQTLRDAEVYYDILHEEIERFEYDKDGLAGRRRP